MNVRKLQLEGFIAGSSLKYDFRSIGVEEDINVGILDVRNVMGIRWAGTRYAGERVRNVPSKVRGSNVEGVRMIRVRAASIGARTRPEIAAAAVEIKILASGEVEASIEASGMTPDVRGTNASPSATPNSAARKLRKNPSSALVKTL